MASRENNHDAREKTKALFRAGCGKDKLQKLILRDGVITLGVNGPVLKSGDCLEMPGMDPVELAIVSWTNLDLQPVNGLGYYTFRRNQFGEKVATQHRLSIDALTGAKARLVR